MSLSPTAGLGRTIQRRLNLLNMLLAASKEPRTIAELAIEIGVSRPAAEAVINDLDGLGWLQTCEPVPSIGRPAVRWVTRPGALYALGLEIGSLFVTGAIGNYRGEVIAESSISVGEEFSVEERLAAAKKVAQSLVRKAGIKLADVSLCCVAAPGVVHDGRILHYSGRGMPGWVGLDLQNTLSKSLKVPVMVAGDCALGALGETWLGAAVGHDEVVYVMAGPRRVGAAAIVRGRVHTGHQGSAGIIGDLPQLGWAEIESRCYGEKDCPVQCGKRVFVFEEARAGREQSVRAVAEFAKLLASGAAAMVLAFGPSRLVLGGTFAKHADIFLDLFAAELAELCPILPSIEASTLGPRAVPLGAVRMGLLALDDSLRHHAMTSPTFPSARFRDLAD